MLGGLPDILADLAVLFFLELNICIINFINLLQHSSLFNERLMEHKEKRKVKHDAKVRKLRKLRDRVFL